MSFYTHILTSSSYDTQALHHIPFLYLSSTHIIHHLRHFLLLYSASHESRFPHNSPPSAFSSIYSASESRFPYDSRPSAFSSIYYASHESRFPHLFWQSCRITQMNVTSLFIFIIMIHPMYTHIFRSRSPPSHFSSDVFLACGTRTHRYLSIP